MDLWIHKSDQAWSLYLPSVFALLGIEAEIQFSPIFAFFCGKIAEEFGINNPNGSLHIEPIAAFHLSLSHRNPVHRPLPSVIDGRGLAYL